MNQQIIFERVKPIFYRIISNKVEMVPETASRDIRAWDSLNHVMFISEIEKEFGIRFDLMDMLEMRTIAEICKGIEKQLRGK